MSFRSHSNHLNPLSFQTFTQQLVDQRGIAFALGGFHGLTYKEPK